MSSRKDDDEMSRNSGSPVLKNIGNLLCQAHQLRPQGAVESTFGAETF